MIAIVASLISALGSGVSGFFGFKNSQMETVKASIDLLSNVDTNDVKQAAAAAQALQAILTQGIWLEKIWRPALMITLCGIIGSYWFFGYTPPYFNSEMSPMMSQIFELLKIGMMGYIPGRTIEKVMTNINISGILKTMINKKLA